MMIYPMSHFAFEHKQSLALKTYFTQEMLAEGYLAETACYSSYDHTEEIVADYIKSCGRVFSRISEILTRVDDIESHLIGPVCHSGFQRLN